MDPYALDRDGLRSLLAGQPAYRAAQVRRWLVAGVDDPADMTDLPAALRASLAAALDPPPRIVRRSTADSGLTHKVLLAMSGVQDQPGETLGDSANPSHGGPAATAMGAELVESVLMLYPRAADRDRPRATVCVSTQAGCALGCPFCATGQAGFRRQLGVGEIVRQVTVMQRLLRTGDPEVPGVEPERLPDHVTNVVFMGMGEPLANLEPTVAAVRWLHDPDGFALSARAITVSTVGLVPGIRRLAELGLPITLAVSLHAPTDALRDELVPINRQHPLAELLDACAAYRDQSGRRLTFEYVLIDGVNADAIHAGQLAALVARFNAGAARGGQAHVNLIPMNPTPAVGWRAPDVAAQRSFAAVLTEAGVPVTLRHNRGGDIDAACGQLYASYRAASGRIMPAAVGAAERVGALARPR